MCSRGIYIVVYVYGGVRGVIRDIRMMEMYGVYAGGGIRGIRMMKVKACVCRWRYSWRYTQMEVHVVYAGGCKRGIYLWKTTTRDINPLSSNAQKC